VQRWWLSGDGGEAFTHEIDPRARFKERLRVRMARIVEDLVDRSLLDYTTRIHDCDAITRLRDNTEVVGYQNDGHTGLHLQILEKAQVLGLNRDVECCCRFISDENLWPEG